MVISVGHRNGGFALPFMINNPGAAHNNAGLSHGGEQEKGGRNRSDKLLHIDNH